MLQRELRYLQIAIEANIQIRKPIGSRNLVNLLSEVKTIDREPGKEMSLARNKRTFPFIGILQGIEKVADKYENHTIMTVQDYVNSVAEEKKESFVKLQHTIRKNLPKGFEETIIYNMIGYVVPLKIFPEGYHCDPNLPLPFINIAAQKNFIVLYHMGIYVDQALLKWFTNEYPNHAKTKLDMGKSCIRFKKINDIPFDLIGELISKMSVQQWIDLYSRELKK